jgi:hypothetical protein
MNFGRGDFIATKLVLVVVTMAAVASTIGPRLLAWLRGDALQAQLDTGVHGAGGALEARAGVELEWSSLADVTIPDPSASTWLISMLPGLAVTFAVALAAVLLWLVVSRVQRDAPFDAVSVRLLRGLSVVGVAYAFIAPSLEAASNSALLRAAVVQPGTHFEIGFGVQLTVLVASLVCATMAEAFAVGVRMQRDVEGLV